MKIYHDVSLSILKGYKNFTVWDQFKQMVDENNK